MEVLWVILPDHRMDYFLPASVTWNIEMKSKLEKKVKYSFQNTRICLIGYSSNLFNIALALKNDDIQISCIATHVNEIGEPNEITKSLIHCGLYYSMREVADVADAPLYYFSDLNSEDAINKIKSCETNMVMACSAPILNKAFIESFEGMTFNFHGSKIFRGRAGATWQILNGYDRDAVVLHWLDVGIDTGCKIAEIEFKWKEDAYPIDFMEAQSPCFENLVKVFLTYLKNGSIPCVPQNQERPYLPSLYTNIDGYINWHDPPDLIEKMVRGFGWPYPGANAIVEYANRKDSFNVQIARTNVLSGPGTTGFHPKTEGCIIARNSGAGVSVACGDGGILEIETLRKDLGEIAASDVLRVGMRFIDSPR